MKEIKNKTKEPDLELKHGTLSCPIGRTLKQTPHPKSGEVKAQEGHTFLQSNRAVIDLQSIFYHEMVLPALWIILRTYAPYITLPIAAAVGVIGYQVEKRISDKYTPYQESIQEVRDDRILKEAKDPLHYESLKERKFVPKTGLSNETSKTGQTQCGSRDDQFESEKRWNVRIMIAPNDDYIDPSDTGIQTA
ncbi:unnamed protein product [Darwinula stevensoni]|uniref:Uncharacterized protein n=1 Tax=Darwinula stevensoni TaxID=69355 RepID=A0A7R9ACF5_9CRUS|nr:unnamed protein product [Darwinula stevensoni]CAG0900129.1 unnamed protein product [Darwinula stevensoni]